MSVCGPGCDCGANEEVATPKTVTTEMSTDKLYEQNTRMKVLTEKPPDWIMDGCLSKFRVDVSRTLWTYGDVLYNPGGSELPDHILEHEECHADQQRDYVQPMNGEDNGLHMRCEAHPNEWFTHPLEDGTDCPGPGEPLDRGKDGWWRRFLVDAEFRVSQEAEAYGMQYRYFCAKQKDRNARARFLMYLTGQLSGPLYQSAIKSQEARALILKHAKV